MPEGGDRRSDVRCQMSEVGYLISVFNENNNSNPNVFTNYLF